MIVEEPPYELVLLSSDAEMKNLLERSIERGQRVGDCTRPFRWRSLRDPRRDTVWREPERPLALFLRMNCRFVIAWDRQGSGREGPPAAAIEELVVSRLMDVGVPRARVLAIAFDPELEASFRTAWPRIKRTVAAERREEPPDDALILLEAQRRSPRLRISDEFHQALDQHPKELFEALVRLLRLRRAPNLYSHIGDKVSLRALKAEEALARIAVAIASWFPPGVNPPHPAL